MSLKASLEFVLIIYMGYLFMTTPGLSSLPVDKPRGSGVSWRIQTTFKNPPRYVHNGIVIFLYFPVEKIYDANKAFDKAATY